MLRRLVVDEGRSFAEAARILGVPTNTLRYTARKHDIVSSHRRRRDDLHDGDWLRRQFDAGCTIAEVADQLGVNYGTVVNA